MALRQWTDADGGVFFGEYQYFWRCAHYPSAISNFFRHDLCEHGCHRAELLWHDGGFHKQRGESQC